VTPPNDTHSVELSDTFPRCGQLSVQPVVVGTTGSIPLPPVRAGQTLGGPSCVASGFCVAVGSYLTTTVGMQALIESWNGKSWTVVPSPSMPSDGYGWNELAAVSCTSSTFCVAVGDYESRTVGMAGLIESWNGRSWSVLPSPGVPSDGSGWNELADVSCASSTSCLASGTYQTPHGDTPLQESWAGVSWQVVSGS
jgi:hypothetical protein